jgi:ABC-type molybdenum transport system ATPase subunit/photorepair protein PhrA
MRRSDPRIVIIAGPNGAGKTTFAGEFLTNEAGLQAAGRLMGTLRQFQPCPQADRFRRSRMSEHIESSDPDIQASFRALRRAARRARELAVRTRTPLCFIKEGRIVKLYPAGRRRVRRG